jgi:integrase
MAEPRKRADRGGKWQGVAIHPSGRRVTKLFARQREARNWAEELEATWRRDRSHDPRAGEVKVAEWVKRWQTARVVEESTAVKNASHLRNHVLPKWGTWPLNAVDRIDVGAWVKEMDRAGVGPATIEAAVRLFSSIMHAAMEDGRIPANPVARQRVPKAPTKPPQYFTRPTALQLLGWIEDRNGPMWATACDLDLHIGFRIGELLGMRVEAVDWERAQVHVRGVMTRQGWRAYPKSRKSHRTVPIPGHLLDELGTYVLGQSPEAPVFPAPGGGFMSDVNFRNRIWNPAVAQTDLPGATPHTMRHTAASWLVAAGVDLYRVQALLGHESFATTQRYAHLAPDASDSIRDAWRDLSAHPAHKEREAPPPGGGQGL